jgi:hypothetical protein
MVGGVEFPPHHPRSITTMRTTVTTIAVAGLVAAGAGTAAARPIDPIVRGNAAALHATPSQALRKHEHGLDRPTGPSEAALHALAMRDQAQAAYYRLRRHQTAAPAQAATVHVTRAPAVDGGFDWADAGIGAGLAAALLFSAAGASVLRRQHPATR